jgi:hypothetical protein
MIKSNKSFTLSLPNFKLDRTLIRTGTYPDGNCFIHALLRAIDKDYRKQTSHLNHLRIVEQFRKDLVEWITPEIYQSLGNGEHVRMSFLTEFNHILKEEVDKDVQTEMHKILFQLVPYKLIDSELVPNAVNNKEQGFYIAFCKIVRERIQQRLSNLKDRKKVEEIVRYAFEYFMGLFQTAHEQSLEHFKEQLGMMGNYVDSIQMECISKYIGYNFLFIDERTEDTYKGISHIVSWDPDRKTLIFLWVDENHFEIIGDLEGKNVINRIFESNDPLIEQIRHLG